MGFNSASKGLNWFLNFILNKIISCVWKTDQNYCLRIFCTYSKGRKEHSAYHTTKNANWSDIFLRDCFLKHVIEGKIEGMQWRERWNELRKRYWNLNEESPDCALWRTRFGRRYGPVAKETTQWNKHEGDLEQLPRASVYKQRLVNAKSDPISSHFHWNCQWLPAVAVSSRTRTFV
jgi:hypothetical protein